MLAGVPYHLNDIEVKDISSTCSKELKIFEYDLVKKKTQMHE